MNCIFCKQYITGAGAIYRCNCCANTCELDSVIHYYNTELDRFTGFSINIRCLKFRYMISYYYHNNITKIYYALHNSTFSEVTEVAGNCFTPTNAKQKLRTILTFS